jgi:hypothetical protein
VIHFWGQKFWATYLIVRFLFTWKWQGRNFDKMWWIASSVLFMGPQGRWKVVFFGQKYPTSYRPLNGTITYWHIGTMAHWHNKKRRICSEYCDWAKKTYPLRPTVMPSSELCVN